MNKDFQTIGTVSVGVALSLAFTEANQAQAAIVNYEFKVNITEGPLIGQVYTGFFSYDDESEPVGFGYGSEEFFLTEFGFDFDGVEYTLDDVTCQYTDVCVPGITPPFWVGGVFPQWGKDSLALRTKSPVGFEFGPSIFLESQPEFEYGNVGSGVGVFSGDVTYTIVPEPTSTLSFLAIGTLGAASTLKRQLKPSKKDETKVS